MNIINKIAVDVDHYERNGNNWYFGLPSKKHKKLLPGIYTIELDKGGRVHLAGMSAMTDTLIRLPDFTTEVVIKDVEKFWLSETKAKFDKRKLVYKRGIILHGLPGTGKSACLAQIMEAEVNAGGIVFFCPSPNLLTHAIKCIRKIEKRDIRCLVVWEEFDELLERNESDFLSLLDGEMQIDNVVYLATTNYLDRIPPRFKNRPSRFAKVIKIDLPNEETRKIYLSSKIYADENIDISMWAKKTEGFTIDHLKDLVISVLCLDVPFNDALDRLSEFKYDEEKDEANSKDKQRQRLLESMFRYRNELTDTNEFD